MYSIYGLHGWRVVQLNVSPEASQSLDMLTRLEI